jgi:hypothetical protein
MSFKFMKKRSNSTSTSGPASTVTSPELQIIENNVMKSDSTHQQPTSMSIVSNVEQKETYVNMIYPSTAASCSTEVPTIVGTISPLDEDDDSEMIKSRTKKSMLGPFRLGQLGILKSSKFTSKGMSTPPPCELTTSSSPDDSNRMNFDCHQPQKALVTSNSSTGPSRLKKFFLLSRADPSRKRQKDISLRNLRHVL